MAIIKCCQYCVAPKRHPGCHGSCPEYLKEKAEYDNRKEQYNQQKAVANAIYDQRSIHVRKALKHKRGGIYHA